MDKWQGQCIPKCPPGLNHVPPNGICKPPGNQCPPPKEMWNGQCVPKCPPGFKHTPPERRLQADGHPASGCLPPKEMWNGKCVAKCPPGFKSHAAQRRLQADDHPASGLPAAEGDVERQVRGEVPAGLQVTRRRTAPASRRSSSRRCLPAAEGDVERPVRGEVPAGLQVTRRRTAPASRRSSSRPGCLPPKEMWNGQCVAKCPPGFKSHAAERRLQADDHPAAGTCLPPKEMWNGSASTAARPASSHTPPNGACKPTIIQPPKCLPPKEMWKGSASTSARRASSPHAAQRRLQADDHPAAEVPAAEGDVEGPVRQQLPARLQHTRRRTAPASRLVVQPPKPPGNKCLPPKEIWNGKCVNKCPPGRVHLPPNGLCGLLPKAPSGLPNAPKLNLAPRP